MIERLGARWNTLPVEERGRLHGLALCAALYLVHFALLSTWYIEDAAISFAYARHLATGEGFVAWPGGERVEGFSNPSWTLLLALADLVRVNPFVSAKLLGAGFGLGTLVFAYDWCVRLVGRRGLLPVLGPLLLAVSPQFVIWNASGLENALLNFCIAAAGSLMLREARSGGTAWSGLPLGVLAITRPDAPLYCAVLAAVASAFALRARGWAALRWIAAVGVISLTPLLLWEAFSWWYFAWPLPNTYYAKADTMKRFALFGWDSSPWRYLRGWSLRSGWGLLLPFVGPMLVGFGGLRGRTGIAVGGLLVLLSIPGFQVLATQFDFAEPEPLVQARVVLLGATAILLPLLGLGRRGDAERMLAWYLFAASVWFALYAGGDWMRGWRWFATSQVPLAVLLPDLLAQISERFPARRRLLGGLVAAPVLLGTASYTVEYLTRVETSPYSVYQRVRWMQLAQKRLHLDHVVYVEVDFGAQMWWSGFELVDKAGLNDVAVAHHSWERDFVAEYFFEEREPDFIHSHGSWGRRTGMLRQRAFRSDFIEIPGYPSSRGKVHVGNHVRKNLFVKSTWSGADDRTATLGPVRLVGVDVPAPEVAPGQVLYVELGWQPTGRVAFRPLLFLAGNDQVHSFELPPAYDWYPEEEWRSDDILHGRHTLRLPPDLPPGRYDLGLVVLGPDGEVLAAEDPADTPRLARGELRWDGLVEVQPLSHIEARVDEGRRELIELLAADACEEADASLQRLRRHLPPDHPAQPRTRPEIVRGFARCWARLAASSAHDDTAERAIRLARRWDHRDAEVRRVGRELADRWELDGRSALDGGDIDMAWGAWRRALAAEPTRSWLVRETEALRDRRLGIGPMEEG